MNSTILIVVAHPDDETLGCAHELLRRPQDCFLLHTTDGAPFAQRFWAQAGATSREQYAHSRRQELLAAMHVFGIPPARQEGLPIADREAARQLPALIESIADRIRGLQPALLYTHPFEGGHPDHDATAFAVHQAIGAIAAEGLPLPQHREFTGYHARHGEFFCGAFLEEREPVVEAPLTAEEQARKQAALACFESQQRVIQRFTLSPQRWRPASSEDFLRRPHPGPLYYEIREMGYRFEDFASLVAAAQPPHTQKGSAAAPPSS